MIIIEELLLINKSYKYILEKEFQSLIKKKITKYLIYLRWLLKYAILSNAFQTLLKNLFTILQTSISFFLYLKKKKKIIFIIFLLLFSIIKKDVIIF